MNYTATAQSFKEKVIEIEKAGDVPEGTWDKEFSELWDIPAVHLTSICFRTKHKSHKRAIDALMAGFSELIVGQLPYITASDDPTKLWVYPEIIMDMDACKNIDMVEHATFATERKYLDPLIEKVKEDLKHDKKQSRWDGVARSKKTLFKRNKMSIPRLITRYTNAKDDGMSDSVIRDKATTVEEELSPIILHIVDDVVDLIDMYEEGPESCMMSTGSDAGDWTDLWDSENELHPVVFYAASPEIKGAYIRRKGKVVARTLLYDIKGMKPGYGRIYSATGKFTEQLISLLEDNGYSHEIENRRGGSTVSLTKEFNIPGVWSDSRKDYLCPVPYFDNLSPSKMSIGFDIPKKEFIIYMSKSKGTYHGFDRTQGFLGAKGIVGTFVCSCCGDKITDDVITSPDNSDIVFCDSGCASRMGYVQARQSDNAYVWKQRDSAFNAWCDVWFSTRKACLDHGGLPYIERLGQEITDAIRLATDCSYLCIYDGERVFMAENIYGMVDSGWKYGNWEVKISKKKDITYEFVKTKEFYNPNENIEEIDW